MSRMTMTAGMAGRTNHTNPRFAERLSGLLAAFSDMQETWAERLHRRRELAELDDRMLEDIGLDRIAVDREIAKPFWRA